EYRTLIREAALAPALFREIHEKYPNAEDRHLETRLINENEFSPDGARQVVKAYRATAAFARLDEAGYNESRDRANDPAADGDDEGDDQPTDTERRRKKNLGDDDVGYSWPLEDAEKVEVTFVGNPGKRPTRRDLEAVIDYLELVKKRTPQIEPSES